MRAHVLQFYADIMETRNFVIILVCILTSVLGRNRLVEEYRLNENIRPELYDIIIKPYLQLEDGEKQFTFDGEVNITILTYVNINEIKLHKKLINIFKSILYDANGKTLQILNNESMVFNSYSDILKINLTTPLLAGKRYMLHFIYNGEIRSDVKGFYRTTNDNVTWYGMALSYLYNARFLFPCFDEPEYKATFCMHINRHKTYNTFFNTRLKTSTSDGNDRFIDHFEETPVMSTYLIAFLITDYKSYGDEDFKIIQDPKVNNNTHFAFAVGLKALNAFDIYTEIPYKTLGNTIMQMVSSPFFGQNGVECWGLILYKETALAQEPDYTDGFLDKQFTIFLVVHETSHMWFGNSVTLKWWSHMWLNEGFATYYQYLIANEIYPEYEFHKQFVVNELHLALRIDSTSYTQPLTSHQALINTPSNIEYKANFIAYGKGACIIRMFRNLMGKDNFDKAIRAHLKSNLFQTTTPRELFRNLNCYWPSDRMLDLYELFKDWTEQEGYPMVHVSVNPCGQFLLKQQRFLLDPSDGSDASIKYTIPITFNSDKANDFENLTPIFYLNKHQDEKLFGNASQHKWIVINAQQSNYYRVFYDTKLLKELKIALMNNNISGIHINNRASIVDDLFNFGRAGLQGYDQVLQFMEYLATETEYIPWLPAFEGLAVIYARLTLAQHNKFKEYIFEIMDKVFQKLGFENQNDSVLDIFNRNHVISWLCKYHHEQCDAEARAIYNFHYAEKTKPCPDFREALYCAAVRNDDSFIYENLKEMFLKQQLPSEKEKILRAMGCTRYFVWHHFEFLFSNNVDQNLKQLGFQSLYIQTPENIMPVFYLIIENMELLTEVLPNLHSAAMVIRDIAQYFTTEEQLSDLKQIIQNDGHLFGTSISILEDAIETVEKNLKWATNHLGKLMDYLTKRYTKYRLSKDIRPSFYDILVKVYIRPEDGDKQFTFDGEVNITIQANINYLNHITLHKKYIRILEVILYDTNGNIIEKVTRESILEEDLVDKLTIYLVNHLEVDTNYTLNIKYEGQIRNGSSGVFRATEDNVNWYVVTQMQTNDARSAFPCFDEPEFKAKFRMRISRPTSYNSVSNTKLIKSIPDGPNFCIDHFEVTPTMSTYLTAFLISDFEIYGRDDLKFITHSKFKNKTDFAYEAALKIIAALDNYTQLPYNTLGNPVMQMAASSSFRHNGMENWGLVIFRSPIIVHEPGYTDDWSEKQLTINTIAHEISHMWFGNSVTLKWWSHFWLNEAFARYYHFFMAHEVYPEYDLDKQFVVKQLQNAFQIDATNFALPLTSAEESISTPLEISMKISGITYTKGAVMVRMFANLMGKDNFRKAIREYLKESHLKNVAPENLFEYLKDHWPTEHQVDLDKFFSDWTEQVGYPVVSVSVSSNSKFILKQERFLYDQRDRYNESLRYTIPITFNNYTKNDYNDLTPSFYFNKTLEEVEFGYMEHDDDWVILNTQQSNYFRVLYDTELLENLHTAFEEHNHSGIHVSNRAAVVNDLFNFAFVGHKSYTEVFDFIEYLATETEYTPWYAAFEGFTSLYSHFTLQQHTLFGRFLHKVLDKVYNELGFENSNDTILDVYNRYNVINWLCRYNHEDCNAQARNVFHKHMSAHTKPTANFRQILYCAACRNDRADIYYRLKEMFKNEKISEEKEKILRAMGCTRHNLELHYEFILSNDVPHDLKMIGLASIYSETPENIMPLLKLMFETVEELEQALQSWVLTAAAIHDISPYLTTTEQLYMLDKFVKQKGHLFGTSVQTLESCINSTHNNIEWGAIKLKNLFNYHSQRSGATSLGSDLLTVYIFLASLYYRA